MSEKLRISEERYQYILRQREQWIPLSGGLSNSVFALHDSPSGERYVIKVINKQNDQLFIVFEQFFTILDALDTTLYASREDCVVVERFVPGQVVDDERLFDIAFFPQILHLTETAPRMKVEIARENIVLRYVEYLSAYARDKGLKMALSLALEEQAQRFISLLADERVPLTFNHLDIQKYNIIHDRESCSLALIDWEYAGFTWEHLDVANCLVLLFNAYLEAQLRGVEDEEDAHERLHDFVSSEPADEGDVEEKGVSTRERERFDFAAFVEVAIKKYSLRRELLTAMMFVMCYLWGMWAYVKQDISKDKSYGLYAKRMHFVALQVLALSHQRIVTPLSDRFVRKVQQVQCDSLLN